MKKTIHPSVFIAALSLFIFVLPLLEKQSVKPGIPLYKIEKDGTTKLIRIVPIDNSYVPENVVSKNDGAILAEKV